MHRSLEIAKLAQQQSERRVKRSRLQKAIEPPRIDSNTASSDPAPRRAASRTVRSRGPAARYRPRYAGRHDAALEQTGQPGARATVAELREHERDVLVLARDAPARAQRPIERLVNEARHLGFVRHLETGIQIGLERKLPQQRQAERVDGADRDVGRPVAQLAPAARRKLARARQPREAS